MNMRNLAFLLFYQSLFFGITLFYFNWYASFTGTSLYDSVLVFLFNLLFNTTPLLLIGVMNTPVNSLVVSMYPALYLTGVKEKQDIYVRFFLEVLVEALLQGTFVFYASIYSVLESAGHHGERADLYMQQMLILYSVILIFNAKTAVVLWVNRVYSMLLIIPALVVLVIIYIYVNGEGRYSRNTDLVQTTINIFQWKATLFALIVNVLGSLLFSYAWYLLCNFTIMPNVYNYWAISNQRK